MTLRAVAYSLVLTAVFLLPAQAATQDAAEVVKSTSSQVLDRLVEEKPELEKDPSRIYELINKLVIPHFDFVSMSRWVLGRESWRTATPEQRQRFVDEFQTLLVRTYAKALLEYSDEEITYYPAEGNPESNMVVVKTEVQQPSGSGTIPIHYRMHRKDGEWKVVDVAVDGVSLVSTYRGSFASEIRKSGIGSLIEKLKERNNKLNTSQADAGASGDTAGE